MTSTAVIHPWLSSKGRAISREVAAIVAADLAKFAAAVAVAPAPTPHTSALAVGGGGLFGSVVSVDGHSVPAGDALRWIQSQQQLVPSPSVDASAGSATTPIAANPIVYEVVRVRPWRNESEFSSASAQLAPSVLFELAHWRRLQRSIELLFPQFTAADVARFVDGIAASDVHGVVLQENYALGNVHERNVKLVVYRRGLDAAVANHGAAGGVTATNKLDIADFFGRMCYFIDSHYPPPAWYLPIASGARGDGGNGGVTVEAEAAARGVNEAERCRLAVLKGGCRNDPNVKAVNATLREEASKLIMATGAFEVLLCHPQQVDATLTADVAGVDKTSDGAMEHVHAAHHATVAVPWVAGPPSASMPLSPSPSPYDDWLVPEGSRSNFLIVDDNDEIRISLDEDILVGVTLLEVLAACRDIGVTVHRERLRWRHVRAARAVAMLGTSVGVLPVAAVDACRYDSASNRVLRSLMEAYSRRSQRRLH